MYHNHRFRESKQKHLNFINQYIVTHLNIQFNAIERNFIKIHDTF